MSTDHIIAVNRPGDRGWIAPGSPEHSRMISPSKVGAILGLSRWESPYRLWHRMRGLVPPEPPKDAFDLGHDVEPFAANLWRRRNPGWRLSRTEVQFVVDPDHFGFPAVVTCDGQGSRGMWRRIVQMKMARDAHDVEKFGDDLSGDCPPDYWTQVLAEMLFSGFTEHPGHLLVLGPYYSHRIYEIEYNTAAKEEAAFLIDECRSFWLSLQSDEPPELDNTVATFDCIKQLHPEIDGTTVELDRSEAIPYADAREAFAKAEADLQFEKNLLLKRMANAQYAEIAGIQVARRQPGSKGGVSFYPSKSITADKILAATNGGNEN